jgi:hypothetical protein
LPKLAGRFWLNGACPGHMRRNERSSAVDAHDEAALAEDGHRVPRGDVGDPVLFGKRPLGGKLPGDLVFVNASRYVVSDLMARLLNDAITRGAFPVLTRDLSSR